MRGNSITKECAEHFFNNREKIRDILEKFWEPRSQSQKTYSTFYKMDIFGDIRKVRGIRYNETLEEKFRHVVGNTHNFNRIKDNLSLCAILTESEQNLVLQCKFC